MAEWNYFRLKVKLKTWLATSLSLKIRGGILIMSQGLMGVFTAILLRSGHFIHVWWQCLPSVFTVPYPSPTNVSIYVSLHGLALWCCLDGCPSQGCQGYTLLSAAVWSSTSFTGTSPPHWSLLISLSSMSLRTAAPSSPILSERRGQLYTGYLSSNDLLFLSPVTLLHQVLKDLHHIMMTLKLLLYSWRAENTGGSITPGYNNIFESEEWSSQ